MLVKPMPSAFLLSKTSFALPDLRWAFENGIIGAQVVVDVASAMLADGNESERVVQLAALTHQELPEVKQILGGCLEGADIDTIGAKWLWLTLSWVYEQEGDEDSVFDTIDELYADFGYPKEMVPFGPYAPAYQGKRDRSEVRRDVLQEWRRYLARGEERFGRPMNS